MTCDHPLSAELYSIQGFETAGGKCECSTAIVMPPDMLVILTSLSICPLGIGDETDKAREVDVQCDAWGVLDMVSDSAREM